MTLLHWKYFGYEGFFETKVRVILVMVYFLIHDLIELPLLLQSQNIDMLKPWRKFIDSCTRLELFGIGNIFFYIWFDKIFLLFVFVPNALKNNYKFIRFLWYEEDDSNENENLNYGVEDWLSI